MMLDEFNNLQQIKDENNPFSILYKLDEESCFYVEPVFFTQLQGFKEQFADRFPEIINRMLEVVRKNHKVVFTGNFEFPQTEAKDFIFLEITDITDPLKIYAEDKSRGSDYGD